MKHNVRRIKEEEIGELLDLYTHLNKDEPLLKINKRIIKIWKEITNDSNLIYLVAKKDGKVISSCTLAIIKNMTKNARPYAIIENVVTHENYRGKGIGTAVLHKAIELSRKKKCYKVMLLTGRKDEKTLRFYENAGFVQGVKTGFLKRL